MQVIQFNIPSIYAGVQVRERSSKHWKPEFKKLRRLKVCYKINAQEN